MEAARNQGDRLFEALAAAGRTLGACKGNRVVTEITASLQHHEYLEKNQRFALVREGIEMRGGVFICYRREKSAFAARAIHDRIVQRLDRENVFLEVDKYRPWR